MMKRWLLLLCLMASPSLHAASAIVEEVRMPSWSEHDGVRTALAPGLRLGNSDVVTTGSGDRVSLKLEDKTTIKLGESAKLTLDNMVSASGMGASYRAAVSVPQGAFRLSTKPLHQKAASPISKKNTRKKNKARNISREPLADLRRHEFNVHAGALTAVFQSGDIFGKAHDDRAVIVLFKGQVGVTHDDTSDVTLTRANLYVNALDTGLDVPVKAAAHDLRTWKAETDLVTGRGIASRNGRWKVSLGIYRDRAEAEALTHQLDEEGYATELTSANVSGRTYVRLQIPQMKTRQDAVVVAERVRQQFDLDTVTVMR